ncbi:hypothetical protein LTR66_015550 [Elasticomyces elasticus]|nr:hypothetical protein LTR66_015550 [Elasticomyces elasticus]
MPRPSKKSKMVRFTRSVAARTVKNRKSRLLNLPAELRNRIYSYALATPDIIDLAKRFQGAPQLLSVRAEALGLFFLVNTFRVCLASARLLGPVRLRAGLQIHPSALRWLRSLPPAVVRIFKLSFNGLVRSQNLAHECCVTIQVRPGGTHVDVSLSGLTFVSRSVLWWSRGVYPNLTMTTQERASSAEEVVRLERAVEAMMAVRDQGKGLTLLEIVGVVAHCNRFG